MDIGNLISRAAKLIMERKHLIGFAVAIVILNGEGRGHRVIAWLLGLLPLEESGLYDSLPLLRQFIRPEGPSFLLNFSLGIIGEQGMRGLTWVGLGLFLLLIIIGTAIIILRGTIIAGASEKRKTLRDSLRLGWRRTWRMLIVASIPVIPITIAAILVVAGLTIFILLTGGITALSATFANSLTSLLVIAIVVVVCIPFLLMTILLTLLHPLAERACVLDEQKAVDSFKEAWQVVGQVPLSVLLVLMIQFALSSLVSMLLLFPLMVVAFFPFFIPLVWLLAGTGFVFGSVIWTVAWEDWSSGDGRVKPLREADV